MNTLIEHKNVLSIAAQVISGALEAGADVGNDEEHKRSSQVDEVNIPMQELNSASAQNYEAAINSPVSPLQEQKQPLLAQLQGMVSICYMAGTILKEEQLRFKKMVYRATRGKALTYFRDLDAAGLQDYSGSLDNTLRSVYVIIFQEGAHIRDRL